MLYRGGFHVLGEHTGGTGEVPVCLRQEEKVLDRGRSYAGPAQSSKRFPHAERRGGRGNHKEREYQVGEFTGGTRRITLAVRRTVTVCYVRRTRSRTGHGRMRTGQRPGGHHTPGCLSSPQHPCVALLREHGRPGKRTRASLSRVLCGALPPRQGDRPPSWSGSSLSRAG